MAYTPPAQGDFLGVDISGIPAIQDKLAGLYGPVADAGVEAGNEYLLGALKSYPPYMYVSWAQVGGFISDRQRRYVMARIHDGTITPGVENRTNTLSQGWVTLGQGVNQIIVNEVPYAFFVVGEQMSRMHFLQGWHYYTFTVQRNMTGIKTAFQKGVNEEIAAQGLAP